MPPRPRSLRASRLPLKRSLRPRLEDLEVRLVLSTQQFSAAPEFVLYNPPGGIASEGHLAAQEGIPGPYASSMTPAEITSYYGVNDIYFGNIQGNGKGQTIAIVDAYDDPALVDSTSAGFATSDLAEFDKYFNLPDPPSFMKYSETGSTTSLPAASTPGGWDVEESLDVEWAHVMAPDASIDLVEATTQDFQTDMLAAIQEAASLPNVCVVSMSFGYPELPGSANFNSDFVTPAGHQGVTFVTGTSDIGSIGQDGVDPFKGQPAFLPNVISVGGTSLATSPDAPTLETAWEQGGGGISKYEAEPSYQEAVQQTGFITAPDVSADADPDFGGVAVYDSYGFGTQDPWNQIGGTSLATPLWGGLIADADEGRVLAGGTTLDGPSQTLPALFSLPYQDFNDILAGDNEGHGATPGYDEVTGLGSPRANLLVPDLAAYDLDQTPDATAVNVTVQPPSTVDPGTSFGLSAAVQDTYGNTDVGFNGTATLTSSLTGVVATVPVTEGVAIFDGLTLSSGQSATYTVAITVGGTTEQSQPTIKVTASSTSGSEDLYPAPSFASLSAALQTADSDSAANVTIILEAGTYELNGTAASSLLLENTSGIHTKNITIEGAGLGSTLIVPSQPEGWAASIFEILGTANAPVDVTIKGLTIEGGEATSGGILGGKAAVGGGILNDGGDVTLSQVALIHDYAIGNTGTVGAAAKRRLRGGAGGAGAPAAGGGLYMAGGKLSLNGVTFFGDVARGGRGGTGGVGGTDGGGGGSGGFGGSASGGGLYVATGKVTGSGNTFSSDAAVGGSGGYGGMGGLGGTPRGLGAGGNGGFAGPGAGGGLYVAGGSVTLGASPLTNDLAKGGRGGTGGQGGFSHPFTIFTFSSSTFFSTDYYGRGGDGGFGGDGEGGGVFVGGGSLTLGVLGASTTDINDDRALGGFFGFSGDERFSGLAAGIERGPEKPVNPGAAPRAGHHDAFGSSSTSSASELGTASGGGIYLQAGSVKLYSQSVSDDLANFGGGIYNASGALKATGLTMKSDFAEIGGAIQNHGSLAIKQGDKLALISNNAAATGVDGYSIGSFSQAGARGSTGGAIANYGSLKLSGVKISQNNAKSGGAIYSHSGSIKATTLNVVDNSAVNHGGGIYTLKGALTIKGGTVDNNTVSATGTSPSVAIGSGGGIDAVSDDVHLTGVTLSANSARAGGGLYLSSGSATIVDSDFGNPQAPYDGNLARQDGGAIYNDGTLSIQGGSLAGNTAEINGGAIDNYASLTIDSASFTSNSAYADGGAIDNFAGATFDDVTVSNNAATDLGGGIDNGGTFTIIGGSGSKITSNTADDGGGVFDVGAMTIKNATTVSQNVATVDGGGFDLGSGGRINATGNSTGNPTTHGPTGLHITSNTADTGNGGGIFEQRGALTISFGAISENHAPANKFGDTLGGGGGVYDSGGKISLTNTPVTENTAINGAGLYIASGSVSLQSEQFQSNAATEFGGGIFNQGTLSLTSNTITMNVAQKQSGGGIDNQGKLTIINSTLSQNTATAGSGGDLYNDATGAATITQSTLSSGSASSGGDAANAGSMTISTSTISNGSATSKGGGLSNVGAGSLKMTNSTVADNASTGNGGGIDNQATLDVVNVTIAYNSVGTNGSGGGLDVESGTAGLFNTIVVENTGGSGYDVAGSLSLSSSNNLFGTLAEPLLGTAPNLVDVTDPLLGQLANNGGPTQTIALLEVGGQYSPAIDGGSNALAVDPSTGKTLITDQRGALRGAMGINAGATVDIGAFEASSSYLVTSNADSLVLAGTLRSGVQWATGSSNDNPENIADPAPNTIVFDNAGTFLTPQTITLTSTLALPDIPAGVEILEPNSGIVTVKGSGGFQVIQVTGGSATIEGLTITGGSATSGGGIGNAGNLTLDDVTLMGNSASNTGGGVSTGGTGSLLTINGGTIEDNTAPGGAGVYSGGSLNVNDVTIEGNKASEVGGGIDMPDGGSLTLSGSTITENSAATHGGGLFLGYLVANISGGSIAGNSATLGGGLYSNGTGSSLTITGTSLTGNSASTGGAIDAGGMLSVAAASLSNNSAATGGAIDNSGTNATIAASSFVANSAGEGGGINNSGVISVSATTLSGNSAGIGGGIASQGTLTVVGSTFAANTASTSGGGIYDVDGQADQITNATFAGNSAAQAGGGIYATNSVLTIVNSTIAYNLLGTAAGGAGLTVGSEPIALYNTLIAGNSDTTTNTPADDIDGTVTGLNNLIGTGGSGELANGSGGNIVVPSSVTDPATYLDLAGTLASNGGPTQTIALGAGSEAIDAGANQIGGIAIPTTDQRGAVRGNAGGLNAGDAVDIGAYEASSEYLVTSAADSNDLSTLRTGINWANVSTNANPANIDPSSPTYNAPNTVEFSSAETIDLSSALGSLVLSNTTTPVAIQGPTASATISGGGAVGVLQVMPGVKATLGSVVITDGSAAAGGGINNAGDLTIAGSTISGNTAQGSGGGISNAATGTLTLNGGTTISGNTALGYGGGISNSGDLQLNGTMLSANTASAMGGGIFDPGTLTLVGSTVSGNSAGTGGGIAASGMLNDSGSTISGNTATLAGGGIAVQAGGNAYLSGTTVGGNVAGSVTLAGSGGGIDNAGTLTLSYATIGQATVGNQKIAGNVATGQGGGVDNEATGTLSVSYSYLAGNDAATSDGGALVNYGAATIAASTIASNLANSSGGGISTELGGTLGLSDSTLSGNSATSSGGALSNAGTTNATNATIAGNQSGTGGGVFDTGVMTVINGTIAYNSVTAGGSAGGLDAASGSTTALYNTIVAQNTAGVNLPSDASGSLAAVSEYDLFGTGGSGGLVPTSLNGIQVGVKNPHLDVLNDDGGPTETIALLAGSPAIDAGSASIPNITVPTLDQRGAVRGPAGLNAGSSPDIGAYEASSSYLVGTTADTSNMGTLRSAIAWANVSTNDNPENLAPNATAPNTVVFDTASAFSTPQTITISSALGPINLDNTSATGEQIDGTASSGLTISGGGKAQLFTVAGDSTAILTGVTLTDGYSATSGGAVINSGNLAVNDSTLSANSAADGGGAIDNLGALTIQSSTLNNNSAGEFGGAIDGESSGAIDIVNSTIAFNGAPQGGGIYSTGSLTTINDTIAYNTSIAGGSGGGLDAAGGATTLYNTIVAQNTDSSSADDIAGTVSGSYNLIGTGGSGGLVNGVDGNQVGVASPGIGTSLTPNGGPTLTIPLQGTSPAIAAAPPSVDGQTITQDQRGTSRGTTSIDIGSFELSDSYVVTSSADSMVPGTLRSAINWADTNNSSGLTTPLVITFGSLFDTPQVITLGLGTLDLTNTTRPVMIEGPGAASDVAINGNGTVGVFSIAPGANISMVNLTIEGGNAAAGGGINNAGSLGVSNVVMAYNYTPSGSGAAIDNTGTLTVSDSSFSDNSGSYYGGAIFNDDGTATITDSNFVDNSTLYGLGGAIDNLGGTLTVTGGTFQGNSSFQGGAIYNRNDSTTHPGTVLPATANINGATITGNSAYQGGGLFNEGTLSVLDSTVAFNTAFQGGAASNDFGGTMTLVDSTIAGNTANQYGGAIDNVSTLAAVSDTIAYNVVTPGGSGGGIDAYSGTTTLYDTIVALNTVGTGTTAVSDDITGQVSASSSYNLVGTGGLVNGVNNNIIGSKNPGLAPNVNGNAGLANNGGPTETIALVTGSPAIGTGSAAIPGVTIPANDQRGVAGVATAFDIGAFQGSIAAPTTTSPTSTPILGAASSTVSTAAIVAAPAVVSAPISAPVTAAATPAPVVSGASPFSGRHLHSRGHRAAKAAHHPEAVVHKTDRVATPSRKGGVIRIAKKR